LISPSVLSLDRQDAYSAFDFAKKTGNLLFSDSEQFQATVYQANLSAVALRDLEGDLLVVAQMREMTHFRRALELSSEELVRLNATDWRDPQRFDLSFESLPEVQIKFEGA
jgi:hypothetical protein